MPTVSKSTVIATVLFFACATFLLGASTRRRLFNRAAQQTPPRVTNRTSSVQISGVRRLDDGVVEVTFVNQSTQPLYAYTIITAEQPVRQGMTVLETSTPVSPGETKAARIVPGNVGSDVAANESAPSEIVFAALYYEGGSVEGDTKESGKLKARMLGIKEQSKLALEILRDIDRSPEQDAGRLVATFESRVNSMPVKDESAPPSAKEREYGRKSINDRLLGEIRRVRTNNANSVFDVKRQLAEFVSYYERLAEKL